MMPSCLVLGANGATGRLVVQQLLKRGYKVRALVRSRDRLGTELLEEEHLDVVEASISEASEDELRDFVEGCDAVVSCLGHNLSFRGIFGHPRQLVTDATRRLCEALSASHHKSTKYVLLNTVGNSNRDLDEHVSLAQRVVIFLLRHVLPPHKDNENAADFLRCEVGQLSTEIEWVAVRPDALFDERQPTEYKVLESPSRSAIFDPGRTSRINVAHFIADLLSDEVKWKSWKGRMPVIYNVA